MQGLPYEIKYVKFLREFLKNMYIYYIYTLFSLQYVLFYTSKNFSTYNIFIYNNIYLCYAP